MVTGASALFAVNGTVSKVILASGVSSLRLSQVHPQPRVGLRTVIKRIRRPAERVHGLPVVGLQQPLCTGIKDVLFAHDVIAQLAREPVEALC